TLSTAIPAGGMAPCLTLNYTAPATPGSRTTVCTLPPAGASDPNPNNNTTSDTILGNAGQTNSHCPSTNPHCNTATSPHTGPHSPPACDTTRMMCVECTGANQTQGAGGTPVCNTAVDQCVQCNTHAQCAGQTPHCDASTHTCGPCASDAACGGSTPACDTTRM